MFKTKYSIVASLTAILMFSLIVEAVVYTTDKLHPDNSFQFVFNQTPYDMLYNCLPPIVSVHKEYQLLFSSTSNIPHAQVFFDLSSFLLDGIVVTDPILTVIGTFPSNTKCKVIKPTGKQLILYCSIVEATYKIVVNYRVKLTCSNYCNIDTFLQHPILYTNVSIKYPSVAVHSNEPSFVYNCSTIPPPSPIPRCINCMTNVTLYNKTAGQKVEIQSEVNAHITHLSSAVFYHMANSSCGCQGDCCKAVGNSTHMYPHNWMTMNSSNPNDLQELSFTLPFDGDYLIQFCTSDPNDQGTVVIYHDGMTTSERATFTCPPEPVLSIDVIQLNLMDVPGCPFPKCCCFDSTFFLPYICRIPSICTSTSGTCLNDSSQCSYAPSMSITLNNNGQSLHKVTTLKIDPIVCSAGMFIQNGVCTPLNLTTCCPYTCCKNTNTSIATFYCTASLTCMQTDSPVSSAYCCPPNALVPTSMTGSNWEETTSSPPFSICPRPPTSSPPPPSLCPSSCTPPTECCATVCNGNFVCVDCATLTLFTPISATTTIQHASSATYNTLFVTLIPITLTELFFQKTAQFSVQVTNFSCEPSVLYRHASRAKITLNITGIVPTVIIRVSYPGNYRGLPPIFHPHNCELLMRGTELMCPTNDILFISYYIGTTGIFSLHVTSDLRQNNTEITIPISCSNQTTLPMTASIRSARRVQDFDVSSRLPSASNVN